VHPELVADVATVKAGAAFHVGVLFRIDPTWHIYWRNPGDSGLATEVDLKAPPGFTVHPMLWPMPKEFGVEGLDDVNYGYERAVLLFFSVSPPEGFEGGAAPFSAKVQWLACGGDGVCVPGFADLDLSIPTGDGPPSEHAQLFQTYFDRTPKGRKEVNDVFKVSVSRGRIYLKPKSPWVGIIEDVSPPLFPLEGPPWEYSGPGKPFKARALVPDFRFQLRKPLPDEKMPERLNFMTDVTLLNMDTQKTWRVRYWGVAKFAEQPARAE
jgi:thiol:disulfide interchange protein DsbD